MENRGQYPCDVTRGREAPPRPVVLENGGQYPFYVPRGRVAVALQVIRREEHSVRRSR